MKVVSKEQAIFRKNSEHCCVTEYEMDDPDIDFAIVTVRGRYPNEGRATNMYSKEIVYIQEGQGNVEIEGNNYLLKAGDVVLIKAGERFSWNGNMTLFISCHPAFRAEQHQHVE